MINKGLFTSTRGNWKTPKALYQALDAEFRFDFDPCPTKPKFNGLEIEWGKCNYVNPPYGYVQKKWIEKGFNEAKKGKTCVFLIPSRTDTIVWHRYIFPFSCPTNVNKDICWATGIVDGEGCVSIQKHNIIPGSGMVNPSYGLRLAVKMTHLKTVNKIKDIFNCGAIYKDHTNPRVGHKWEIRGHDAYKVLRQIYPFSVTKKKEIFLALNFYAGYEMAKGRARTKPEQVIRSEEYYRLLRKAKKEDLDFYPIQTEIRIIKGRLKFDDQENSAPFPSAIVIFDSRDKNG